MGAPGAPTRPAPTEVHVGGGPPVLVHLGTRADGDLAVTGDPVVLEARRRAIVDLPWVWLTQVHGATVVDDADPDRDAGRAADAAVTGATGVALAVHTADCAPVVLVGPSGRFGVAHAGWRGVEAGVLEATVAAVGGDPTRMVALVGPTIDPGSYAFGVEDLDRLADRLGDGVRGRTADGGPALDVRAAVDAALAGAGVTRVLHLGGSTAGDPGRYPSHRARGDRDRIALVAWRASA